MEKSFEDRAQELAQLQYLQIIDAQREAQKQIMLQHEYDLQIAKLEELLKKAEVDAKYSRVTATQDQNPEDVLEKITAFDEILANPEPPQRLGLELKIDINAIPGNGWDAGTVIHRMSTQGIALLRRSTAP